MYTICQEVDAQIETAVKATFNSKKSKKMERGIAFPTCISINNIMGHFSPLKDESVALADGDVCKIMLGTHFDGYASNAGFTIVVGTEKVTGRKADVVLAAHKAMQAAQRAIREAASNTSVTEAIAGVCADYGVEPVEGVLSHKIKKHLTDGNDCIINKETSTQQVKEFQFAPGDVIGLDVYVSSGEGKPKEAENRCTVYKRELQTVYNLKMKSSLAFFKEVNQRFPTLPFSLRAFADSTVAKVGVRECGDHDMLVAYPVLTEKPGEFVAQFHCTIAVLPKSTAVLSGNLEFDEKRFESEKSIKNEKIAALLATDLWKKDKEKKAK